MSPPPYRTLLIAEAANPEWVSVPLVGWSLARALAARSQAHLVTHIRNRAALLRAGLTEGRDFTVIDNEAVAAPLWRIGELLSGGKGRGFTALQAAATLAYPSFERQVWARFGNDIRAGRFDVVHRITPLSPTAGGPLAARVAAAGVPFVLGPLNGGVPWPAGFDHARRAEREWLSYIRRAYKALPGTRASLRHASAVIAGSRHTAAEVAPHCRQAPFLIPENAVDPARFPPATPPADGPLRAVFVGRLVPYKGPDMVIEAAAPLLAAGRMELTVIGDGPLRPRLEELVAAHGIAASVHMAGWADHAQVAGLMADAHVLTFPSIREFGGGVVLEAMAMGVVPIVADYAGPAELVDDACGYRLPLASRAGLVAALRDRLTALCADRSPLGPMAAAGRARVAAHFTWARKAEQVLEIYDWVTGRRADRPVPISGLAA